MGNKIDGLQNGWVTNSTGGLLLCASFYLFFLFFSFPSCLAFFCFLFLSAKMASVHRVLLTKGKQGTIAMRVGEVSMVVSFFLRFVVDDFVVVDVDVDVVAVSQCMHP